MRYILFSLAILFISGCTAIDVRQYSNNQPSFDLIQYFNGTTKGWGLVQDRSGVMTRQFVVTIEGQVDAEGNLVMNEDFVWNDGEKSHRTWTIAAKDSHIYIGKAEDVVGTAIGSAYGNVLNWQYHLNLKVDDSEWKIHFDDWMFLQTDGVLINRATMSKFGFRVGEVTIAFSKNMNLGR
jgi:hypothetical protein